MNDLGKKSLLTLACTVFAYCQGIINELFVIFAGLTILDYITGSIAAILNKKWTKQKAVQGIFEKAGFFILFLLTASLDFSVTYIGEKVMEGFSTGAIFTTALSIWLIGTEGKSNLNNLREWGTKVPKFLTQGF
ncbi:MAG: phage holin family protein, partial [Clostridiaceae bacterium]|nr:phage holin family protein [Clostridiaceae bacterium]